VKGEPLEKSKGAYHPPVEKSSARIEETLSYRDNSPKNCTAIGGLAASGVDLVEVIDRVGIGDAIPKSDLLIVSENEKRRTGVTVQVCDAVNRDIATLRGVERRTVEAELALLKGKSSCKACEEGDEDG
jgi:hypothetical protein